MKKFVITGAVALALAFSGFASNAQAQTVEEQIAALMAQIAALQGGSSSSSTPFTWNGTLIKQGSRGTQVSDLQACMNALGFSTGVVDGIYGPMTYAGITAFQASKGYAVDGIVGPQTAPGFEMACNGNMNDDNGDDNGDNGTVDDGTEGSVDNYDLGSADETEALEGEEEVEIYAVDVELADDGDLLLERVDVWFSQTATAEDNPWDYFKEVHLLVDGDVVASEDADSSSDWSDKATGNLTTASTDNEYRMRFSGLDSVFSSDDTTTVSVAVTMVNTIDSNDQDAVWVVGIDSDSGFRWVDGTGFIFTEGDTGLEDSFTVGNEETASIDISLSSDNPDPQVLEVDDNSDTNDVTVSIYNVEESQGVDVNITEIDVDLTVADPSGGVDLTGSGAGAIIKRAHLVVDGDVIGTETVTSTDTFANNTGDSVVETITFDNLDWDLDADDDMDVEVVLDFKDTNDSARYDNGTTVTVTDFEITELEDANGNDEGDITTLTFTTDSETHEVRDEGIMVEFVGSSYVKTPSETTGINETVEFTLEFDVTAFGDDMWVDQTCAVGTTGTDVDAIEVSLDNDADGSSTTCTDVDSTGDEGTNGFEVKEGQTETFTVTILGNGGEAGGAGSPVTFTARINGVGFNVGTDAAGDTVYAFDMSDYKSKAVTVYDR